MFLVRIIFLSFLNLNLVLNFAFADNSKDACHYNLVEAKSMKVNRIDRHAPCSCKPFNVMQFNDSQIDYFIEGIQRTKGADIHFDLDRDDARTLWYALNENKTPATRNNARNQIKNNKVISYYDSLVQMKDLYGFNFISEGEILEALVILELEDKFPKDLFFVTGGISYYSHDNRPVTGELDLVVYETATCSVVSVGEAKLTRGTNKAREQIARFRQFLRSQGRH